MNDLPRAGSPTITSTSLSAVGVKRWRSENSGRFVSREPRRFSGGGATVNVTVLYAIESGPPGDGSCSADGGEGGGGDDAEDADDDADESHSTMCPGG
ncbi:hypothetical protein ON010_g10290 [Phytophthora cinnamomi]|nr:hypothetical protein ON010_g10290 [Phytophthora cinnamomi]